MNPRPHTGWSILFLTLLHAATVSAVELKNRSISGSGQFIERAASNGAIVLIGDPKRNYFPHGRFTQVAEYQVPVSRELEDAEIKKTAVWRL